ncbi:MAG TPA: hypothetical protein DD379_01110 [Cyanobacteria bacterium UBA11162]|nr:hypothetical protein [Cyanobacteria bacterium UBA11162]
MIERANPVLNGLNQFKVQRLSEEQGEVSLLEQQPEAGAIQRKCSECEAELADKEDKHPVQAKLELGQPEDKYEQEADAVARTVVEKINAPQPQQPVQRQSDTGGASELNITVMRHSSGGTGGGSDVTVDVEQGIQQARGGGQGLDESVREPMEQAFGADFSGVRVHTDAQSDQLNRSIQAKAFTTGQDIFFKQGEYQPGSRGGQELLAHELTHVVQQTGLVQRQISPACRQTNRYPGNLEHEKIEQDYQQNVNSNSATEFSIPGSGPNGGIGYADIVDLSTHAIYEIKTFLGSPLGVIEANRYRQFAEQKCDPNVEWQLGTQYPYRVIPLDAQRELVAQQYPQFPGVITYYTRQQQKQPQPDPVRFPVPVPVPQQEQQPVIDRRTALQQIADFVEQVIQSGENAERAALRFLTEHPKIKYFLIGAAIIILVATLIQDLLTLGAGIADDPASFSIVWTLVRVAQTIP